ncbi:MAG: hypothetical protein NZM25_09320 [Leptospiraceae bacterium]|nr:hypothetical protein [Leptospiraceae bacterium]MDW8307339.1 hypothetical protein [Leptospiraceae bacterium]
MEKKYPWFTVGDINAFFGLMLDNVTNLVLLASILIFTFGYPAEIIYAKMFPGTALGVFVGDLLYTVLAFRLSRKTGKTNITAMPLGLDTPSTIGIAYAVIGPAFLAAKASYGVEKAALIAWHVAAATLFIMGILKLVLSFLGSMVERIFPTAALLGSIAGIGIALLGFLPLVHTFSIPMVGLISLGLILYALVARIQLPLGLPSVLFSIVVSTVVYYLLAITGLIHRPEISFTLRLALPQPSLGFWEGMGLAVNYLPLAIPFGLLTVVGGINVTASARLAGDSYETRHILLCDALATVVAAVFGGVSQSTAYIGHPAYKAMGGRAGYTLLTGLFIGLGGILGYISLMAELIPTAALAPILIFVGLEIVEQAYETARNKHAAAITMAVLPSVAELARIQMSGLYHDFHTVFKKLQEIAPEIAREMAFKLDSLKITFEESWITINALGHGFVLTGMLWGAITAYLIEKKYLRSVAYLAVCALFSFFGIIHSVLPEGGLHLPWKIPLEMKGPHPYVITSAYLILAGFIFFLSRVTSALKNES